MCKVHGCGICQANRFKGMCLTKLEIRYCTQKNCTGKGNCDIDKEHIRKYLDEKYGPKDDSDDDDLNDIISGIKNINTN